MDDVYHICNKKLEHQFLSEVDKKRPKPSINPGTQPVGVYEEIWYIEVNAEQQTIVNDFIEKIKKSSWW